MFGDRQEQRGGDHSINIQGGEVHVGLTYQDARQVAMDVFDANFQRLSAVAADVAHARAAEFLDDYLARLEKVLPNEVPEAQNPDFQYALYTAQKEYARTGDADLGGLLVQLLIDRTDKRDRDLLQIVLNESLEVAPKLTQDQLDALSLVFLVRYTRYQGLTNPESLGVYLDRMILPFGTSLPSKDSAFQHLEFAGCGNVSVLHLSFEDAFRQQYADFFTTGFDAKDLLDAGLELGRAVPLLMRSPRDLSRFVSRQMTDKAREVIVTSFAIPPAYLPALQILNDSRQMAPQDVRAFVIETRPDMARVLERWDNSPMKQLTLTSVGIAIAHANVQRRTGDRFDLSIWI